MQTSSIKKSLAMMHLLLAFCVTSYASDLDDGIEIDDKIKKYDTLGKPKTNVQYVTRRAKANVSRSQTTKDKGDIAIGGFINKPGAEVGDVTIIFDGEDITAVSQ